MTVRGSESKPVERCRPAPARDLSVHDFWETAARIRESRPHIVAVPGELLRICDGIGWEHRSAGAGLTAGSFVRVADVGSNTPMSAYTGWHFVGKLVERHSTGRWLVDLGADHGVYYVVPDDRLFGVLVNFNEPGLIDQYLYQCALQGRKISRRLGPNGQPVSY